MQTKEMIIQLMLPPCFLSWRERTELELLNWAAGGKVKESKKVPAFLLIWGFEVLRPKYLSF